MTLPDDLTGLADRARDVETRATAARNMARVDLEAEVSSVRDAAQAQSDRLRQRADEAKGAVSDWWESLEKSWNEHLAAAREASETKRGERKAHEAQKRAEDAEEYASLAIDFAYAAMVEAEYAVLDAALAKMDADELAEETAGSA